MYQPDRNASRYRGGISLSVRVSLWLVFAAIIPLAITVIFSEWYTRPALIAQANTTMQNDAKTRVELIQTYLNERQLDTQTLTQVPSAQTYLHEPYGTDDPEGQKHALYSLIAGAMRDESYTNWSLFDTQGRLRLAYPHPPASHGKYLVPPVYQQTVKTGKTVISDVYFDPRSNTETVDIYSPMYSGPDSGILPPKLYLGFMRATLKLNTILAIVNGDKGNNGSGSYAFLLDKNGIRIATNDVDAQFTAIAPLSPETAQSIRDEQRYGTTNDVPVLRDNELAARLQSTQESAMFQIQPAEKNEMYQVVEQSYALLNWKYFVLSPVSTTTTLANQQLLFTGLVVLAMGVLAILVGLIAARRIATPVTASMHFLRTNSQALGALAQRQQDAAAEQIWVVDSSQVGLQSIQYYTEAIAIAAHSLSEISLTLTRQWNQLDIVRIHQALERIVLAAHYIENAAGYQRNSNVKLETALKVATQVTEQLATGATSATQAAMQLEDVVDRLRSVVGR
ncbi:MAG TPA: cache domain-containing protein [Ktedonobacteraceae bacterium]|jgi:hypothetical protein|nr:cache domain-containing protein [Ktedonobacteraceae bacterium]